MIVCEMNRKFVGMYYWCNGAFGNKLRTWNNILEWRNSNYKGNVGLRYMDLRGGGAKFKNHIPYKWVYNEIQHWVFTYKRDIKRIIICEEAPDHRLLINGELTDAWTFYHSRIKKSMRQALKEGGRHMYGLQTRYTLQQFMTPSSYSDLEAIIELYPNHIIELSVYECLLGKIPGRNTIIWEVRKY